MQPAIKSSIPRKLCSLNREKAKLKSGTSLLLITNFIYLIKFNLVLINLRKSWPHTKFFSQCSFCTNLLSLSGSILTCPIFPPPHTVGSRTKLFSFPLSGECMLLGSLSPHNKNLEWRTLKPSGWVTALGSWTDRVIALRSPTDRVTALK